MNRHTMERSRKLIRKHWQLYIVISLPLLYILIFKYIPMYGAQIAFKDYFVSKGILGSPWVGFKHFERFFSSYHFNRLIKNTLGLSFYQLLATFPAPILLALALNELAGGKFKKTVQMVTYAPFFISTVVLVSIVMQVLSPRYGIINTIITFLGGTAKNFMAEPAYFKSIYVWSGVWQHTGYLSVIYIAALSAIDPELYEAAVIDGASRLHKIIFINIPSILPTAVILLILNVGRIMKIGFEKVYLMQNPLNLRSSEIIVTYVYKIGLINADYSFSAAIGLFNSIINLVLIVLVNQIAKKVNETSLW